MIYSEKHLKRQLDNDGMSLYNQSNQYQFIILTHKLNQKETVPNFPSTVIYVYAAV